jgi:hypothetical protein
LVEVSQQNRPLAEGCDGNLFDDAGGRKVAAQLPR